MRMRVQEAVREGGAGEERNERSQRGCSNLSRFLPTSVDRRDERHHGSRRETHPGMHRRNLNRVRDHVRSHSFLDRTNFGERDRKLLVASTSVISRFLPASTADWVAHRGDPSENVRVEREVVFRNVQSPLDEDLTLKSTSIICADTIETAISLP